MLRYGESLQSLKRYQDISDTLKGTAAITITEKRRYIDEIEHKQISRDDEATEY